eukprot:TRINITY_DN2817_c0_g1_i1.p1 TRINITY_DN2817_c0_g1~~TRINITY_DN2817_c0_g1_i1.p1  ORF type:complete len:301 (+),score=62.55 TRINITY_DN2817_c0_g1_i1:99-1001(+)
MLVGKYSKLFRSFSTQTNNDFVSLKLEDKVGVLTINNPAKRNALSLQVLRSLIANLNQVKSSIEEGKDKINVLIIKSEGPVFCSGHDLKELKSFMGESSSSQNICDTKAIDDSQFKDGKSLRETFSLCEDFMLKVHNLPVPVITQVGGMATAAGCQLVAASDICIASENATFQTPGVKIGLFCSTPGVFLSRAIHPRKGFEMLVTGLPITANEALLHGLVNKVVKLENLEEETMKYAKHIASASGDTLRLGKRAFYKQIQNSTVDAMSYASNVMVDNLKLSDANEGISAFLEKRKPEWKS